MPAASDPTAQALRPQLMRVFGLIGSRLGGTALTLVYTVLLVDTAPKDTVGLLMNGMALMMLGSILVTLNLETVAIRVVPRYLVAADTAGLSGFGRYGRRVVAVATLALTAGLGALVAFGALDPGDERDRVLALALAGVALTGIAKLQAGYTVALDAVVRSNLPISVGLPAFLCVSILVYRLAGWPARADTLMLAVVASQALTTALQAALAFRLARVHLRAKPRFDDWREWVGTGMLLGPNILVQGNLKHLAIASAGLVLAATELAEFGLALSLTGILVFAVRAVDWPFSPRLSSVWARGDRAGAADILWTLARVKTLMAVVGGAGLATLGPLVLGLFGPEYAAAYAPALWFVMLPLTDALFGPAVTVMNVAGRSRAIFLTSIAGFAAVTGGTLAGGMLGGAQGAAAGCGFGFLLARMLECTVCARATGLDPSILRRHRQA